MITQANDLPGRRSDPGDAPTEPVELVELTDEQEAALAALRYLNARTPRHAPGCGCHDHVALRARLTGVLDLVDGDTT